MPKSTTLAAVSVREFADRISSGHASVEGICVMLKHLEVAKGTVSKVRTVLTAIQDGKLKAEDVRSLNSAYQQVLDSTHPRVKDLESAKAAITALGLSRKQLWKLYAHVETLGGF